MPAARPQLRMTARFCHSKPGTCLDRYSRTALCHTVLSLLGQRYTGRTFHAPYCMSASTAGSRHCCVVLVAMPRAPERLAAWPLGRERPLFWPTVNTHLALDIHPDIPPHEATALATCTFNVQNITTHVEILSFHEESVKVCSSQPSLIPFTGVSEDGLGLGCGSLEAESNIDEEAEEDQPSKEHQQLPQPVLRIFLHAHHPRSYKFLFVLCFVADM